MPSKYPMNIKTNSILDDPSTCRLAAFYASCTSVYFVILVSALFLTNYVYSIGKLTFYPVIGLIAVLECTKYVIGIFHVSKKDVFSGRYEDKYFTGQRKKPVTKTSVKEVFNCIVIVTVMLTVYFAIAILFGAELFNKHEETFMFSSLLTVLTIFPSCLHLESQAAVNLLFGVHPAGDAVGQLLLRNLQFTLLGAWLGAFVIPLDWDRPWQEWPIPCCVGALLGYITGNIVMVCSLFPNIAKKLPKSNRKLR
ncbi:phosphatidylinositol-glycan biosynthesis class F protein [Schistocerca serialis cubense]|uniref:phosphatidylinositol-glycan biosynthesis class F protein n=1 Tax=Schistocerca serialis cubense TaxID=2023355 RepID=UPI00214F37CA|nr:phosphatidylinositol-glycan biosynthesis class F protein [Schistocerca serialis cubense]